LARTEVSAGITSHLLTDALGSSIALTDNAGTVQTEYTYEPFGQSAVSGLSNSNSYQFTGRENDGLGLYYYRARYYSPMSQRFISEDPLESLSADLNLYAYASNDPVNLRDPTGEWSLRHWLAMIRFLMQMMAGSRGLNFRQDLQNRLKQLLGPLSPVSHQ
jgi:RHS repeat-associated protein